MGHPELLGARLAAPLLSDVRRLRVLVPRTPRDHRVGEVRSGPGRTLRQLHGALRLRADGGRRHVGVAARIAARRERQPPSPWNQSAPELSMNAAQAAPSGGDVFLTGASAVGWSAGV